MSKILKNQTGSPIVISDTGVTLPASPATYTIPQQDYLIWAASADIVTEIGNSTVIVNDGSFDLGISEGVDLIKGIFPTTITIEKALELIENENFGLAVARGIFPNIKKHNVFGHNDSVGSSPADVWNNDGTYTFPSTASTLTVYSSSNSDKPSSTGAHKIEIQGLDSNYLEITEIVTLDGKTHITTTNSFRRVNYSTIIHTGSSETNVGNIFIKHGALTLAKINTSSSQSQLTMHTVPANKWGIVMGGYFQSNKAARADFRVRVYDGVNSRPFTSGLTLELSDSGIVLQFKVPFLVPPRTDMKLRANTQTGSARVSAGYEILWIDV